MSARARTRPTVDILMPANSAAAFIARAIASVLVQTRADWQLTIIDDGSTDGTATQVATFLDDARIRILRIDEPVGLGAALNRGLDAGSATHIAYLPADDLWYRDHLASLLDVLTGDASLRLAYAGVRHDYNRISLAGVSGLGLQLVQCLHRRSALRWVEQTTLVSDDLERLYWAACADLHERRGNGAVTCEFVAHADKLQHLLREPEGGLNTYRQRFGVRAPLRFHTSTGNPVDEQKLYRRQRERPDTPRAADGLKIVLAGELAYNADRVLALEEAGHRLYGLWMERPWWYNTVGPLPFGHVTDIPRHDWQAQLRRIRPDLIYAQLNWQAVPFAHHVLEHAAGIPFIWHFKEGPFICLEQGTWPQLLDLYRRAAGQVFSSALMRDWFATVQPGLVGATPALILDGDLPRAHWFDVPPAPRLAQREPGHDALHTVVPGRPIGLHPHHVAELARHDVHLHFYGDFTHGQWRTWIDTTRGLAPHHLHLHPHIDCDRWVAEFSRYDAGWLHFFASHNHGELRRANWDDLNIPARLSTLAAAGLPLLQKDNRGHSVATQDLVRDQGNGLLCADMAAVAAALRDTQRLAAARAQMQAHRFTYCFDTHVPRLVAFMRAVIANAPAPGGARRP